MMMMMMMMVMMMMMMIIHDRIFLLMDDSFSRDIGHPHDTATPGVSRGSQ